MIEKERIDHLYKYIEIDDDVLKFILDNGSFTLSIRKWKWLPIMV